MVRRRVYELAQERDISSKEVLEKLRTAGLEVKTASSSVDEEAANDILGKSANAGDEEEKPRLGAPGLVIRKKVKNEIAAAAEHKEEVAVVDEDEATDITGDEVEQQPRATAEDMAANGKDVPVGTEPVGTVLVDTRAIDVPVESAESEIAAAATVHAATVEETDRRKRRTREPIAKVVRMIDQEKLKERVPPRRFGGPGHAPGGPGRGPAGSGRGPGGPGYTPGGPGRGPAGPGRGPGGPGYAPGGPGRGPAGPGRGPGGPGHPGDSPGRGGPMPQPLGFGQVTEVEFRGGQERRRTEYGQRDRPDDKRPKPVKRQREVTKRDLLEKRERSFTATRLRKKKVRKGTGKTQITKPRESKRIVKMSDSITVGDIAHQLGVKVANISKYLVSMDIMARSNETIDFDTAQLVATEYEYKVENTSTSEDELLPMFEETAADKQTRPPVVTVMGHVDHGKTSILDAIRSSDVAANEQGGITQHIGAYSVEIPSGTITFIDTPGHAAFTSMRARGAQVTDLVVLVVAADDGVMPQTVEAINHAQAAQVPIIVAINKIDLPGADPQRVMQALTEHNLVAEDWGGDTMFVKTSAVNKEGIDELLEGILLQAEVMELQANPNKPAAGVVIEAQLDKGRGPVATVLVKEGTLKINDYVVAGSRQGKIRAMIGARGQRLKDVGPAMPVEVLGLSAVPSPGDPFHAVESLNKAKALTNLRDEKSRETEVKPSTPRSLEELMAAMEAMEKNDLLMVVKADTHGTMEAVRDALIKLSNDEVEAKVIHSAVGGITESDVMLASASGAIIVGFNVRSDSKAAGLAEQDGVQIKTYRVIYEAIEEIKAAMTGMLKPIIQENVLGRASVQQTFRIPRAGTIAGCNVQDGKIARSASVRLIRDDIVIYEGKISSLKRFKDDVREVNQGYECGIGIEHYNDIKVGDFIESFVLEEIQRDALAPALTAPKAARGIAGGLAEPYRQAGQQVWLPAVPLGQGHQ